MLVWFGTADRRMSRAATAALSDATQSLYVSAVTAYEFADLNRRGRFGADLPFQQIVDALFAEVLDFPAACWRIAEGLPMRNHRDPVDRMLVAHAIYAKLTIVTADEEMRRYPVATLS